MEKDKIEVGEYIRTKEGILGKCTNKYYDSVRLELQNGEIIGTLEHDKYKHSKNIIDLIEVGDYVNGGKVVEHAHEKGRLFVSCTYVGGKVFTTFEDYSWELTKDKEENIETIVTKEQFKEMEYRV